MSRKKSSLPFDKRGGILVINRRLLNSEAYATLKPAPKVFMLLLHEQWRNEKPVSYGVREAAKKIHCNVNTAAKSFKALEDAGFIQCVEQSNFNSKLGSKARDWRLTWLPYMNKEPSNEWDKPKQKIKSTVPKEDTQIDLAS